ncbi:hypothetical protein [Mesorhizobium sp. BR-1-1-10]|uniref:hypothetical protein n=1 Tax=Mesorhizobium sp. BR-1-1-10 TaxID=2876660 RepID=UPI001CD0B0AE|nr:hypothetical protein [Mesorhizobium sp. BR-1-1-10]MBZ9977268.1 hypothetical protein [Mesorhizobium sp. BR-1-1-10]
MRKACLVFVGSLNREAPYFQGARGVGLGVYGFDEETLETRKLAETNDIAETALPPGADRISIFVRDAGNGMLTDTGRSIEIGTPMCVKIVA